MTLHPRWPNETFVLPLEESLYNALLIILYSSDHETKRDIMEKYRIKARACP
jgi:hypothetical protein